MNRGYLLTALVLVVFLFPSGGEGQEGLPEITVTAGSMRSLPDGSLVAEGDVLVLGEGVRVRADRLRYDPGSDSLMLTGGVVMEEDGGGAFSGDALALNLSDLTGGIRRGEIIIVPNGFRVRGEDISRTGPEEYSIRKGVFTSCPGDCPDWSFTASQIRVRKEGYLEARSAAFRILGVPVFYTPYLLYPVKTQRQTGLLFPELSFSDETGLASTWPIFVTLGPHADATVSPRTFSRDGTGLDLDSRYRLHWGGGGRITGFAMTGERRGRWFVRGEHAMALSPEFWLRGRWYDTGDPEAPSLFGDDFQERHPGPVRRHATLEGDHGFFGYSLQTSSLLADGALASNGLPGNRLDRRRETMRLGPAGASWWRAGVEAERARFEDGQSRDLVMPALELSVPGPAKVRGSVRALGLFGNGGEGAVEDEGYVTSASGQVALEAAGGWGRHVLGLQVTGMRALEAAFTGSTPRDSADLVQERSVLDYRVTSVLTASRFRWDVTAGAWEDTELELERGYGSTRLSLSGLYLTASRNRDADFGLVLPSIDVEAASIKGWQVEAGYSGRDAGLAVGRDSSVGFPEMLSGRAHVTLAGVRLSGNAHYDMDADEVADETLAVRIPGRCWTVEIERSRSPGRSDWSLQLELGL